MVNKKTLLLIAGIVWCIAGFNVAHIGLILYSKYLSIINVILSLIVFILFGLMFYKMTRKHTKRICDYQEKQPAYKFFDVKSYCIMTFMMTFGMGLRVSGVCPLGFIAVFYSGLGCALFLAGIFFISTWLRFNSLDEQKL